MQGETSTLGKDLEILIDPTGNFSFGTSINSRMMILKR
jgi:hypothetical protein